MIEQDYIKMSLRPFRKKYGDEGKAFIKNLKNLEFSLSHVPEEAKDADNKESYRKVLLDKGFTEEYTNKFISSIGDNLEEAKEASLESLGVYFRHKGEKLTIKDLKAGIRLENITRNRGYKDDEILSVIDTVKRINPTFRSALAILETKVKAKIDNSDKMTIDFEDIFGEMDMRLLRSRNKVYDYYKKKHPLFSEMKEKIKSIMRSWDRVEEDLESEKLKLKTSDFVIEDLNDDLEKLFKLYEKMDGMNYIIKLSEVKIPTYPDTDEGSSLMASNIMYSYLNHIIQEGDTAFTETASADSDDEREITEREQEGGEDEEYRTYMSGYGEDGGESVPMAETTFQGMSSDELYEKEWGQDIDKLKVIDEVDPLYAIAADSGILRQTHTKTSRERMANDIRILIQGVEQENPEMVGLFEELLEDLEELQDQASEVDRSVYHLPFTPSVAKLYEKYVDSTDLDYTEIESFHVDMLRTIGELIELPSDKTLLPYHWLQEDYGIEGSPAIREQESKVTTAFESTSLGRSGKLKDLGKFTDDILELVELAEKYYVDPITDNMLRFESLPKFLDKRASSAITTHGKNEISQLIQSAYISEYTSFISNADLEDINEYRKILRAAPSERGFKMTIKKVERVLDILADLFPKDREADRTYFANRLRNMASKNSNINLDNYYLDRKKLSDLTTNKETDGNYGKLISMIYALSSEMEKDKNKEDSIKEFKELHDAFNKKTKLAGPQEQLLDAHDAIRKMMQKPTYYGVCETDSYDNVNDTIDLIKSQYGVELSAHDISNIVVELDSLESLAKKHGTNEDIIYHVKAIYR
tara:strand:+ start:9028 stop:11472 length:2445 start_codon:yes stop_codon:yes gene_type:complete